MSTIDWRNYVCAVCYDSKPTPTWAACDDCNAAEFYSQFYNL